MDLKLILLGIVLLVAVVFYSEGEKQNSYWHGYSNGFFCRAYSELEAKGGFALNKGEECNRFMVKYAEIGGDEFLFNSKPFKLP